VNRETIRVDCAPKAVRAWRLECIDDSVWIAFGEGGPRPLGATAEVMPAMRRFLQAMDDAGAVAVHERGKQNKAAERSTSCSN
jgi:hypothetical protein